jgi:hypothetical protein
MCDVELWPITLSLRMFVADSYLLLLVPSLLLLKWTRFKVGWPLSDIAASLLEATAKFLHTLVGSRREGEVT